MNKSEFMKQFEALESECKKIDNCDNCILCHGLRNKYRGYWVLNKEVYKEDFEAAKKELLS